MDTQATNLYSLDQQATAAGYSTNEAKSKGLFARKVDHDKLVDMYVNQKLPTAQIAQHFGVTTAAIYSHLKRSGLKPSRKTKRKVTGGQVIPKGKKMWVRRLFLRGCSQAKIADKLELSRPTVQKYLREYGLIPPPVARKTAAKKTVAKKTATKKQQPKAAPVVARATITYVSRPWYRRVIDWFKG